MVVRSSFSEVCKRPSGKSALGTHDAGEAAESEPQAKDEEAAGASLYANPAWHKTAHAWTIKHKQSKKQICSASRLIALFKVFASQIGSTKIPKDEGKKVIAPRHWQVEACQCQGPGFSATERGQGFGRGEGYDRTSTACVLLVSTLPEAEMKQALMEKALNLETPPKGNVQADHAEPTEACLRHAGPNIAQQYIIPL